MNVKKDPDLVETKKTPNIHQESEFCLLNNVKIRTNTARKKKCRSSKREVLLKVRKVF